MKKHFLSLLAALICGSIASSAAITESEALQIVKANRSAEGFTNSGVNFFASQVDTIVNNYRCPVEVSTIREQWVTDNTPKWLIFVDEEPMECWSHNCSYYYVPEEVNSVQDAPIVRFDGCLPPAITDLFGVEIAFQKPQYTFTNLNISNHSNNLIPGIETESTNKIGALFIGPDGDSDDLPRTNADFSLLYQMLTQHFGVSPSNIMMFLGGSGTYSVDADLDGNGIDELIRPYPYDDWGACFDQFINRYRNANFDHIFVYLGPFNYDFTTGQSAESRTNPSVYIDDHISTLPGRVKSVLACGKGSVYKFHRGVVINVDNAYYDYSLASSFVSNWVDALLERDHLNQTTVYSDSIHDGYISLREAFNYAKNHVTSPITATIDSERIEQGLADVLSFDYTPCNLNSLGVRQVDGFSRVTWDCPDLWIRNHDDGITHQESECITVSNSSSNTKYIYVKVRNLSIDPYELMDDSIHLSWSTNAISALGQQTGENHIGKIALENDIAIGDYNILKYAWTLPSSLVSYTRLNGGSLSISLFSTLHSYSEQIYGPCRKQVTLHDATKGTIDMQPLSARSKHGVEIPIHLNNLTTQNLGNKFSIELIPSTISSATLNNKLSMTLELSTPLYQAWLSGGAMSNGFTSMGNKKYSFTMDGAQLTDIPVMSSSDVILLSIFAPTNVLQIADQKSEFFVVLKDENGRIVDGQTIVVYKDSSTDDVNPGGPGEPFPGIGAGFNGSNILLSAKNVYTPSDYEWYDSDEQLRSESEQLNISLDESNKCYTLVVNSTEDGSSKRAIIDLKDYNFISATSGSSGGLNVQLLKPAAEGTVLSVTSMATGATFSQTVPMGENNVTIACEDAQLYVANVTVGGIIRDSRIVVK